MTDNKISIQIYYNSHYEPYDEKAIFLFLGEDMIYLHTETETMKVLLGPKDTIDELSIDHFSISRGFKKVVSINNNNEAGDVEVIWGTLPEDQKKYVQYQIHGICKRIKRQEFLETCSFDLSHCALFRSLNIIKKYIA